MEKFLRTDGGPIECSGEDEIEVEEGKRDDQEIRFVYIPELNGLYSLPFQEKDAGQYHSKQQDNSQRSEIFWHRISPV
jgi:hypothetical protein